MRSHILLGIAAMALTTYLIRVIPMILFSRPIKNRLINGMLFYVPYAVLSAMAFPAILLTDLPWQASVVGTAAALICAWKSRSLVQVAAAAALSAWVVTLFF